MEATAKKTAKRAPKTAAPERLSLTATCKNGWEVERGQRGDLLFTLVRTGSSTGTISMGIEVQLKGWSNYDSDRQRRAAIYELGAILERNAAGDARYSIAVEADANRIRIEDTKHDDAQLAIHAKALLYALRLAGVK